MTCCSALLTQMDLGDGVVRHLHVATGHAAQAKFKHGFKKESRGSGFNNITERLLAHNPKRTGFGAF
jgi:hypothetical protein